MDNMFVFLIHTPLSDMNTKERVILPRPLLSESSYLIFLASHVVFFFGVSWNKYRQHPQPRLTFLRSQLMIVDNNASQSLSRMCLESSISFKALISEEV
jgi:hypothetical protein